MNAKEAKNRSELVAQDNKASALAKQKEFEENLLKKAEQDVVDCEIACRKGIEKAVNEGLPSCSLNAFSSRSDYELWRYNDDVVFKVFDKLELEGYSAQIVNSRLTPREIYITWSGTKLDSRRRVIPHGPSLNIPDT